MVTFEEVLRVLTNLKISYDNKAKFIKKYALDIDDLIDVINTVTIERNFYERKCKKERR